MILVLFNFLFTYSAMGLSYSAKECKEGEYVCDGECIPDQDQDCIPDDKVNNPLHVQSGVHNPCGETLRGAYELVKRNYKTKCSFVQ